jgi:hypothetical protein
MKDPVWYTLVGKEVHTQLHAATRVIIISLFHIHELTLSLWLLLKRYDSWLKIAVFRFVFIYLTTYNAWSYM